MKTLEELKQQTRPAPTGLAPGNPALYIDNDEQVQAATAGLIHYFANDDALRGIDLVVAGEPAGFLPREALYNMLEFESKGLGDGDLANLPGLPEYRLQILHCPQPGCNERCLVTFYRPEDAPFCGLHPTKHMEPQP